MSDKPEGQVETKTIKVDYLARVEGEGALHLHFHQGALADVKLKIFEPPRFFEGFLRGRAFTEAPDITARICGICPVAYQMSAVHAMERALGVEVGGQLRELRRLLYCGEWISSHALHVYMLHAPDFLGYPSAVHMAQDHPEVVKNGLFLKKMGGALMTAVGGREVHPINVKVGGFYRVPTLPELVNLVPDLKRARDIAEQTVRLVAGFSFPEFDQDYLFVALRHDREYPFNEGRLVNNEGLDIDVDAFPDYFEEQHVAHSNALHCVFRPGQRAYHVGPLARYALNFDRLPMSIQTLALEVGLSPVCSNPFKSIIVRALEALYACEEALRIIGQYQAPAVAAVPVKAAAGTGHAITEAPRGLLYHRYELENTGAIRSATIVPPTSQNQKMIEEDLWSFVPQYMHLPDDQLQWHAEQAIRNYDPCISCATHFLKLDVKRS